jgi:hypothetical protein
MSVLSVALLCFREPNLYSPHLKAVMQSRRGNGEVCQTGLKKATKNEI